MKTTFRKLIVSLLVVLGAFTFTSAAIAAPPPTGIPGQKVAFYAAAGNGYWYVWTLPANDDPTQGATYYINNPGVAILMGLNTAMQQGDATAWFIGSGGNYVVGADFTKLQLYRNPAGYPLVGDGCTFGRNCNDGGAYSYNDIFITNTFVRGTSPEGKVTQMMTTPQWFLAYGDAAPIGALDVLFTSFALKRRIAVGDSAPIGGYEIICAPPLCP